MSVILKGFNNLCLTGVAQLDFLVVLCSLFTFGGCSQLEPHECHCSQIPSVMFKASVFKFLCKNRLEYLFCFLNVGILASFGLILRKLQGEQSP